MSDITKKANDGSFHPTPSSKGFIRTESINPISAYIKQNYEAEARKIAKNAIRAKRGLIAPNGRPSNLSPELWLAVRLQSFKGWFGDWENDAENASKAVDENGEPKVFYHHTNAEFTEFLHSKRGKTDAGWLGAGFYFCGIEDEGKGYGKNVMECFLNVCEPCYASDDDMFRSSEADSIEESEAFTESLIEDGYDGVYYDGDLRQEMMVFEPDQIKSATDNRGTFDGGNADITFSVQRKRDLTLDGEHVTQKQAWEYLAELEGMPLRNARSQFVAVVNKPQRKELTNDNKAKMSAENGFSKGAHYAAVSRIESLFAHAVPCGEYPDLKHGEPTVHIHRFACPMMIDGEKAVAWLTAQQTTNVEGSERLYNLELVDIEKLVVTLEYLASHRLDTALRPASGDIVAEVEAAFKTYFEDVPEMGDNFSSSLTGAAAAGRRVLEASGDEYVENRLQEAWQKNLEKWSVLHAGKADANSAMRAVIWMLCMRR